MTFHRTKLAEEMAQQLLDPPVLMQGIRSGLFLGGLRRTGKTTFLQGDLIPALQKKGAIVLYVDLWSDTNAKPSDLLLNAVREMLKDLERPESVALGILKRVKSLDLGGGGFKFSFSLAELGKSDGNTLTGAFSELVLLAKTDVVVIIDEVQHAMNSEDGDSMLLALKATRDAINLKPGMPGKFLFLGTGSHRAKVRELTIKGKQAFNGAMSEDFPVLEKDFVEWLLTGARLGVRTPTLDLAFECFDRLGRRPEEMMKALLALQALPNCSNADQDLAAITEGLRQSAASVDLARLDELGSLAVAIFDYVCQKGASGVKGLYAAETLKAYAAEIGREVATDEVQKVANLLVDANILARDGRGIYDVSDPFIAEAYQSRVDMLKKISN